MTPTTAAVMAVSGAVNFNWPWVVSMKGPPSRMNRKDGKKVKKVTMQAATAAASGSASGPSTAFVQPPT